MQKFIKWANHHAQHAEIISTLKILILSASVLNFTTLMNFIKETDADK